MFFIDEIMADLNGIFRLFALPVYKFAEFIAALYLNYTHQRAINERLINTTTFLENTNTKHLSLNT